MNTLRPGKTGPIKISFRKTYSSTSAACVTNFVAFSIDLKGLRAVEDGGLLAELGVLSGLSEFSELVVVGGELACCNESEFSELDPEFVGGP